MVILSLGPGSRHIGGRLEAGGASWQSARPWRGESGRACDYYVSRVCTASSACGMVGRDTDEIAVV